MNCKMIAFFGAFLLVGCSGGISVSSENAEGDRVENETSLSRKKEISKNNSQGFKVEFPVTSMIADAAKEWLEDNNLSGLNFPTALYNNSCADSVEIRTILGLEKRPELSLKGSFKQKFKNNPEIFEKYKHVLEIDEGEICARLFIKESVQPIMGWPGGEDHVDFAENTYVTGYVVNALSTQIILRLNSIRWEDDISAKKEINKIISELVLSGEFSSIVAEAIKTLKDKAVLLNFSGAQKNPVNFIVNGYDVSLSSLGVEMAKSGSEWYGKGNISGRKYMLTLDSVVIQGMKKSKQISNSETTNLGSKNSETAGVSN